MNEPTITVVKTNRYPTDCAQVRLRIEGGALREDWAKSLRPGRTAWCEVGFWVNKGRVSVGSYSGEVWPSAWSQLFTVGPRTVHGQVTTPSDRIVKIVREALAV